LPIASYGRPSIRKLGERVVRYQEGHDALLLANHGAVTMGRTLDQAWIRMESREHAARIIVAARAVGEGGGGRPRPLDAASVERLEALRAQARREMDA